MAVGTDFIDIKFTPAHDNVSVAGYIVFDSNDVQIADIGNVLKYRVTGLSPGTYYEFYIKAYDAPVDENGNPLLRNISLASNIVSATTLT